MSDSTSDASDRPSGWRPYWLRLKQALLDPGVDEAQLAESLAAAQERMPIPVVWLVGKTQAGKTSIIRALTGSERAEIGNGFQPCTRSAELYDYPTELPLVRFLDTRGLGEVDYDPEEDLRYCERHAHLLLAVMKVADPQQEAVFSVVRQVRKRHPDWPVVIAQTGLHELYPPGAGHVEPYPQFDSPQHNPYPELTRALLAQRQALGSLAGHVAVHWVAVDLTQPGDGLTPEHYGVEALWQAIEAVSNFDLRRQLLGDAAVRDVFARTAHRQIMGHALAAAGLGAMPVIDLVAVTGLQAKLLHALANVYGQSWDKRTVKEFLGLLGVGVAGSVLGQMLGRTVVKLIPAWGQTVGAVWGATASGATTFALGKTAVYFFDARRVGAPVDAAGVRAVYAQALDTGRRVLKAQRGKAS